MSPSAVRESPPPEARAATSGCTINASAPRGEQRLHDMRRDRAFHQPELHVESAAPSAWTVIRREHLLRRRFQAQGCKLRAVGLRIHPVAAGYRQAGSAEQREIRSLGTEAFRVA